MFNFSKVLNNKVGVLKNNEYSSANQSKKKEKHLHQTVDKGIFSRAPKLGLSISENLPSLQKTLKSPSSKITINKTISNTFNKFFKSKNTTNNINLTVASEDNKTSATKNSHANIPMKKKSRTARYTAQTINKTYAK